MHFMKKIIVLMMLLLNTIGLFTLSSEQAHASQTNVEVFFSEDEINSSEEYVREIPKNGLDNASGDNTGVSSLPRTNEKRGSIYVMLGGLLTLFSFVFKIKSREAD